MTMGKKRAKNFLVDVVFIGPVLFAFTMIVLIPLMKGIFLSFTDWNGMTYESFVGKILKMHWQMSRSGGRFFSPLNLRRWL